MAGLWPTGNIDNSNWQSASDGVSGVNEAREQMRANLILIRAALDAIDANAEIFTDSNSGTIAFNDAVNTFIQLQIFTDMLEVRGADILQLKMGIGAGNNSGVANIQKTVGNNSERKSLLNFNAAGVLASKLDITNGGEVSMASQIANAQVFITATGNIIFVPASGGKLFYNGVEVATKADLP